MKLGLESDFLDGSETASSLFSMPIFNFTQTIVKHETFELM